MLKIRGNAADVKEFLNRLYSEAEAGAVIQWYHDNGTVPEFREVSTDEDKAAGTADLCSEASFNPDLMKETCADMPELKLAGLTHSYEHSRTGELYYWSKAGSDRLQFREVEGMDPGFTEEWWCRDNSFDTEENEGNTLKLTGYYRGDKVFRIPEEINGKTITGIGDKVFYDNKDLEDLYIGENITSIGKSVFTHCDRLVVHTDNKYVRSVLKKQRVQAVSLSDPAELAGIKRDYLYTVSDGRIKIDDYRGDSMDLVVPDEIEGFPVTEISDKAFANKGFYFLVLPAAVTGFNPENCKKFVVRCLAAPGIDFGSIATPAMKKALGRGFLRYCEKGIYRDEEIIAGYRNYFKRSFVQFIDECLEDTAFLTSALNAHRLSVKDYETMVSRAAETGNTEATAILMNYGNANISKKDREKKEKADADKAMKAPSASKIKKDWRYKVLEDGTLGITSYNGSDKDVVVPETIEGKPVTAICWYAFGSIFLNSDNAQVKSIRKRRQQIETVTIHSGIKTIEKDAFLGCGNTDIGDRWLSHMQAVDPPKVTFIAEAGSCAEQYAKDNAIPFRAE